MASTQSYRITWEDGTVRYRKLDENDAKAWRKRADDKGTTVKSVEAADAQAINAAAPAPSRGKAAA